MNSTHVITPSSPVQEFYKNKTVFITGANGFVGEVLLEKLLRSCSSLDRVFILLRPKGNLNVQERLHKLCQSSIFETLSKTNPEFAQKITVIRGDMRLPGLGISKEDRRTLQENVHIVVHAAASVKFTEPVKVAMETNFHGTRRMIKLCKGMRKLGAFVHISSAYTNGEQLEIEEKVYPFMNKAQIDKLLQDIRSMGSLDTNALAKLETMILQGKANSYLFTKSVTENYLEIHQNELPMAIVRPSTVSSTAVEPFPGFVDNMMAMSGLLVFVGKGYLHSFKITSSTLYDFIPVDYLANLIILAGWNIQKTKEAKNRNAALEFGIENSSNLKVYNGCSHNPTSFHEFRKAVLLAMRTHPFENTVSRPRLYGIRSPWLYKMHNGLVDRISAYSRNSMARSPNKSSLQSQIRMYDQVIGLRTVSKYFVSGGWKFQRENVYKLNRECSAQDRIVFPLFVQNMNWIEYFKNYIYGLGKYTLREKGVVNATCNVQKDLKNSSSAAKGFFKMLRVFKRK